MFVLLIVKLQQVHHVIMCQEGYILYCYTSKTLNDTTYVLIQSVFQM